ncbi:hypothetical protein VP01_2435g2 [Puccinia sorghi]|uniref:Uncharacterized protein n=1 Tax=Puccinia sorghi TaxID=27349 RepID=A0A0L6V6A0_9BASI|nr:hypothetical protein VP01_2435g2 [Puccinia sorghi]
MTAAGLPSAPGGNSHIGSEVMDKVTKGLVRGGLPGVSMITESVEKGLKAGGL